MCALDEHIAIKTFGSQKSDTALNMLAAFDERRVDRFGLFDFVLKVDPHQQTAIAVNRVVTEINHQHEADEGRECGPRPSSCFVHNPHEPIESRRIPEGQPRKPPKPKFVAKCCNPDSLNHAPGLIGLGNEPGHLAGLRFASVGCT